MAIPVRKTVELYGIDLVIVCLVVIIEKSGGHHVEGFVNVVNAGGKNNEPASHGKHYADIAETIILPSTGSNRGRKIIV
jgi:hypothetical protein